MTYTIAVGAVADAFTGITHILKTMDNSNRIKAMAWWDTLRSTRLCDGTKDKGYYTDKHFDWGMRMFQHLTGREIENIWDKEFNKQ